MNCVPQDQQLSVHAALAGKRILITGSTGFLAKVVLEKLIRTVPDIGRIILLIRAADGAGARTRFEREVATSSVFERLRAERPLFLQHFLAERVECITGAVTEPGFGLQTQAFGALARRVDLVINAAASVNFREALDVALSINALSVRHIAELARLARAPLIQVSTCYVNGYHKGDMHETIVAPARGTIARHPEGHFDLENLLQRLAHRIGQVKAETSEPGRLARRLTELGIAEAKYYGWNDTYTFTKWMGEQLAMHHMRGGALTIVRPSIIESTLQEPAPGWIEGVKVADAILMAYARGKTSFFPAKAGAVVDIIPADMVANAITLAAAEALATPAAQRIYQCSTGSSNPISVGGVIDRFQTEAKRNWRNYERLFYRAPKHDFTVVSRPAFLLMLRASGAAAALWSGARRVLGAGPSPALEMVRTTRLLAVTFSFYTAPQYRFHNTRLMALAARFGVDDLRRYPVDTRVIDWTDYLCRIHMTGLNRYALRPRPVNGAAMLTAHAAPRPVAEPPAAAVETRQ
ncbi:fatty acyl-CoA reductase [Pseudoduganella sp. LjRoot289]|uniref:SDR family oxidoreductase n=1 Tax=Pseudoduganella sp. LjRoot289 TaxID=3342314 RepID=UPI003ECE3141